MARKIEVTLYSFDELSDKAKQRAMDNFRKHHPDHGWWDYVYDDTLVVLTALGYRTSKRAMQFSGFSSQGDGACFSGEWFARNVNVDALKGFNSKDEKLQAIIGAMKMLADLYPRGVGTLDHYGRYSHANSIRFNFDNDSEADTFTDTVTDNTGLSMLTSISQALMNWFYAALESAYNHEVSDENVAETIRANEYEFTEDGAMH